MSRRLLHVDTSEAGREVLAWRVQQLRGAGFSKAAAQAIAVDRRYDLHALLELIDRGCRPDLAARILAPLDERGPGPG